MVADSPAKARPKLPQSAAGGAGYLPMAMPRQREPYLYPFKLPLVVTTLTALAAVALSPWRQYQHLLWVLVFFSSCSLVGVFLQSIRMVAVVLNYHRLYCGGNSSISSGTSAKCSSPVKQCDIAGAKVVVVEVPSRPGHKKSIRGKGHRQTVSIDTADCGSDQNQEAVALVIDCENWSESSGSGSDWSAGPPRWNHVFVIPNYKEDVATLTATLEQLASHAWANTYTILLAMESKEVGAAHKAAQLQEQFACSFHSMVYTLHVLDASEMPGKASNVNAAVRQFYHMVTGDRSSYMLTIMDAGAMGGGYQDGNTAFA
eukprot:GHRR01008567.1.p1 GENE.GHRR01008567.1~~GHRR01008567.1.p1  ORF type:complete len:316 (+),score=93.97 GHRR01008567.1:1538-2485(+)